MTNVAPLFMEHNNRKNKSEDLKFIRMYKK